MRKIHSEETLTKCRNNNLIGSHLQGLNTGGEQVKLYRTCTDVGYYLGNLYTFSGCNNKQDKHKHQRNAPQKQRSKHSLDQLVSRDEIYLCGVYIVHRFIRGMLIYRYISSYKKQLVAPNDI